MTSLLVNGEKILTDQYGYLIHSADWHEDVATMIAQGESLTLIRILVNQLSVQLGPEKASSIYLNKLFPKGILKQASKLAGLPRPTRCM